MQIGMERLKAVMLSMVFLVTACGGGSLYESPPYKMTIDHDAGSSSGTGTITAAGDSSRPFSLTKDGNEATIVRPKRGATGCDGTFDFTLTSPDTAEGFFDLGTCGFLTNTTITRD